MVRLGAGRPRRPRAHAGGHAGRAAGDVEIPPARRFARRGRDHRRRDQRHPRSRKRRRVPQGHRRQDRHSPPRHFRAPRKPGSSIARPCTAWVRRATRWWSIDIGGGSVEITRGTGPNMDVGRSFKLGVIRLTERFVKSDPLVAARRTQTESIPRRGARQVSRSDPPRRLRSGRRNVRHHPESRRRRARGTQRAGRRVAAEPADLGEAAAPHQESAGRTRPPGTSASARASNRAAPTWPSPAPFCSTRFCGASAPKRSRSAICRCAKAWCSTTSRRHRKEIVQADRYPDVRRRSVFELAERCNYWPEHAQQVARLVGRAVRPDARHTWPDRSRA